MFCLSFDVTGEHAVHHRPCRSEIVRWLAQGRELIAGQGGCDRRPPQQRIEERLATGERIAAGGIDLVMRMLSAEYGREPHHDRFGHNQPARGIEVSLHRRLIDDKAGKPVNINKYIGRRPIACFGNSDGDREILIWTTVGRTDQRPSLGLIVHHTDAEREFAYDRQHVLSGQLDKALDEAPGYGWILADMKNDWNVVFPTAERSAHVSR